MKCNVFVLAAGFLACTVHDRLTTLRLQAKGETGRVTRSSTKKGDLK